MVYWAYKVSYLSTKRGNPTGAADYGE